MASDSVASDSVASDSVTSSSKSPGLDDRVLRQALEEGPDGLLIADTAGIIRFVNHALCQMTRYQPIDLLGRPVEVLVPDRIRLHHQELRRGYTDAPRSRPMGRGVALTATRSDGSEFAVEISLSPVADSHGQFTIASIRDITERVEEAERLRSTQEMLTLSSERERIARDLHDTVLQRLFGLGLEIQALAMKEASGQDTDANGGGGNASRLDHAVDEIDLIIKEIRTSVFTLGAARREGSLGQELGDIIAQSARVLGFSPRLSIEGPLENMISPRIRPDLTASLREALANVARHSRATTAAVDLIVHDYTLTMRVIDNGIGLPDDVMSSPGSGLRNLQARAQEHRGACTLNPGPDGGTILEWSISLD